MPKGVDVLLSHSRVAKYNGKPVLHWAYHKRKLGDLSITNALGEKLTKEQIVKALAKPSIVLLSADGKPVHPYYLKIIKPDTLVIIDKTPKPDDSKKKAKTGE